MLTLTNKEVLEAIQLLGRLSQYEFGRKIRYPIDYNLDKLIGPAERIQRERTAILKTYGTAHPVTGEMKFYSPLHQEKATEDLDEFLAEEDQYRLKVVEYDDFGDVSFPSFLVPRWFRVMPNDPEEEDSSESLDNNASSLNNHNPVEI